MNSEQQYQEALKKHLTQAGFQRSLAGCELIVEIFAAKNKIIDKLTAAVVAKEVSDPSRILAALEQLEAEAETLQTQTMSKTEPSAWEYPKA